MIIEHIQPPDETRLATVEELLDQLRKLHVSGPEEEATLERISDSASADFALYLEREPWYRELRITHTIRKRDLDRDGNLWLPTFPIDRVSRLTINGSKSDPTNLRVVGRNRKRINYPAGWRRGQSIVLELQAGWVMDSQIAEEWQPETPVEIGAWLRPSKNSRLFRAIERGITGQSPPEWPWDLQPPKSDLSAMAILDGSVKWQTTEAISLPVNLWRAYVLHVKQVYRGDLDLPMGLEREGDGGGFAVYREGQFFFSGAVKALLDWHK